MTTQSEPRTLTGVSPDQKTIRYLTLVRADDVVEINIHSSSGSGAFIQVSARDLELAKTQADLQIHGLTEDDETPKLLKLEMKEKQILYIHTVTPEGEEGSGWAIYVSRDGFVNNLKALLDDRLVGISQVADGAN